jgi:hypothetical protein
VSDAKAQVHRVWRPGRNRRILTSRSARGPLKRLSRLQPSFLEAGDETRTHDPQLGNVNGGVPAISAWFRSLPPASLIHATLRTLERRMSETK